MASAKSPLEFEELSQVIGEIKSKVEDLVCQVCKGFPKPWQPRWYKCSENHQICQSCVEFKKIRKCHCKGKISKIVDEVTETLLKLKTTLFKCCHCHEKFTKDKITQHEQECTRRWVPCPFVGSKSSGGTPTRCPVIVPLQNVIQHYESEHVKITNGRNGANNVTSGTSRNHLCMTPLKFEAFGKVFITTSMVTINGILHNWVQVIGSPEEAKGFIFSLEYKGPKTTNVFLGQVASISETFPFIIENGKSFSIALQSFKKQFLEGLIGCKYSWSITVKKSVEGEEGEEGENEEKEKEETQTS